MEQLNPYYQRKMRTSKVLAYYWWILFKWSVLFCAMYWLYTAIEKLWSALA